MDKTLRGVLLLPALLLPTPLLAGERTVRLQVDNMDCAACPVIVRTASVTYDETHVTIPMRIEATTQAGYPSRVLK
jgi:mercuric ion binding protein